MSISSLIKGPNDFFTRPNVSQRIKRSAHRFRDLIAFSGATIPKRPTPKASSPQPRKNHSFAFIRFRAVSRPRTLAAYSTAWCPSVWECRLPSSGFRLEPVPHPETLPLLPTDREPRLSEWVQDRRSRTKSEEFEDLPVSRDNRNYVRCCKPSAREDDAHVAIGRGRTPPPSVSNPSAATSHLGRCPTPLPPARSAEGIKFESWVGKRRPLFRDATPDDARFLQVPWGIRKQHPA